MMKKKILILIIIGWSPLALFAQTNQEEDIITLKKLTHDNILYALKSNTDKGLVLAGISCTEEVWGNCTFYLYKNFGNVWQKKFQSEPIGNLHGKIDDFSFEDPLIYFGSHEAGGSSGNGSYYFNAYDPDKNKLYSLNYYWSDYNYSDHGFENLEEIDNQKVLSFLEQKVSSAKVIHIPDSELTLEDHWKIDNKNLYENIFGGPQTIQFHYTANEKISTENKSAENQDYILCISVTNTKLFLKRQ